MTWQEAIAVVVIVIGLGGAAFLVGQRPAFWVEFGARIMAKLWPLIFAYLSKRMTPEEEAEYQREFRAGRGDEWLRKRRRKRSS